MIARCVASSSICHAPWVCHEELEARDAFIYETAHRLERVLVDVTDDLMKPVVDRAIARGLLVPRREPVHDALAVGLHSKVDDRRRASPRGSASAGLEGVGCRCAAKRQLHVGVCVDAAGDDILSGRVDHRVDG
jgi:hypothetical protein